MPAEEEHSAWCRRQALAHSQWGAQRELMRAMIIQELPHNLLQHQSMREASLMQLQEAIYSAGAAQIIHLCPDSSTPSHQLTPKPEMCNTVTYYGLSFSGELKLPGWQCMCCQQTVHPHATAFGCFPMTPTQPAVWFDSMVHQLYLRFGPREGLSATGGV